MDLSIIISACNMQNRIAACLRSVTRCPKENIEMECLVMNNNSTNETAAVVNRYIERDSRIKLVTGECEGIFDMQNKGVETASGEYILFLNAKDRLCEDAWEQIEAAVEEQYADFVAFSYISLRRNGKFKARMLPISEVISTDAKEARKLMYADSVLNNCWGKLFKNRIIRDNNILFRTDLSVGADFLFVAEYFEHCESYLLTKAMILYCPQRDNSVLQNCSTEEQLDAMRVLYDFHVEAIKQYNDKKLAGCMQVYCFDELTKFFCENARRYRQDKESLKAFYKNSLKNKTVNKILANVDENKIGSGRKKHLYRLLKNKNAAKIQRFIRIGFAIDINSHFDYH